LENSTDFFDNFSYKQNNTIGVDKNKSLRIYMAFIHLILFWLIQTGGLNCGF